MSMHTPLDAIHDAPGSPPQVDGRGIKALGFYSAHANGYGPGFGISRAMRNSASGVPTPAWVEACCAYISRGGDT